MLFWVVGQVGTRNDVLDGVLTPDLPTGDCKFWREMGLHKYAQIECSIRCAEIA